MLYHLAVPEHLLRWHFFKDYKHWDRHGEGPMLTLHNTPDPLSLNAGTTDETRTMLEDLPAGNAYVNDTMDDT